MGTQKEFLSLKMKSNENDLISELTRENEDREIKVSNMRKKMRRRRRSSNMSTKRKNYPNTISSDAKKSRSSLPGLNFTNILQVRFLFDNASRRFSLVTFCRKKHFRTKNALIKCWWNWRLGSISSTFYVQLLRTLIPKA
jgi:hypothetical protein